MIEALYIHVPFCHARCAYCDFYSRASSGLALERAGKAYAGALVERLRALGGDGLLGGVATVYIGGGTPTVLGDDLVSLSREVLRWCRPVEFSCEANPESLTPGLAVGLRRAGVTRVSLGVQSLDDAELAAIGRLHTADRALRAVSCAQEAGFSVSADLICGLPGQTAESWRRTLDRLLAAGIDHLSVYPLTVEPGTALARRVGSGEVPEPDEDFQAWCMELARTKARTAGLQPYEVASYAKPGRACRHNRAYWTGVSYLGIGPSAASMLDRGTYARLASFLRDHGLDAPCPVLGPTTARVRFTESATGWGSLAPHAGGGAPAARYDDVEQLNARQAAAEDLMLGLRMTEGVSEALLRRASSAIPVDELERAVTASLEEGLARWSAGPDRRLVPTDRGWLMGNELYSLFWDLAA